MLVLIFLLTEEKFKIYKMASTLKILNWLHNDNLFLFQLLLFLALACAVLSSGKSAGKRHGKRGKKYILDS